MILHTPGGDIAATESLVDYLYSMYGKDIRVIVPQISMSAGTMIAFASIAVVVCKTQQPWHRCVQKVKTTCFLYKKGKKSAGFLENRGKFLFVANLKFYKYLF